MKLFYTSSFILGCPLSAFQFGRATGPSSIVPTQVYLECVKEGAMIGNEIDPACIARKGRLMQTDQTNSKETFLYVHLGQHLPRLLALPFDATMTAGALLQAVGDTLDVPADYVVLFRAGAGGSGSRAGLLDAHQIVDRRLSRRIGTSSSAPQNVVESENGMQLASLDVQAGDTVFADLRPLRGDHIHYGFSIQVNGELVDTFWDQYVLGSPFSSEGMDPRDGLPTYNWHIMATHPHFGIHSGQAYWFGDGFIHIHPGTSWTWFRESEGAGATLDMYLEQIGVSWNDANSVRYPISTYHVPMNHSEGSGAHGFGGNVITFPKTSGGREIKVGGTYSCSLVEDGSDGTKGQNVGGRPLSEVSTPHSPMDLEENMLVIPSNATHVWRAYYYSYFSDTQPTVVTEQGAGSFWLSENLGLVTLSFEARNMQYVAGQEPRPPRCMIEALSNRRVVDGKPAVPNQQSGYYTLGFDGFPYPMPNAQKSATSAFAEGQPQTMPAILTTLSTADRSVFFDRSL